MLHVRKGDQVKILAGKDRGKSGKVLTVNFKTGRAVVEGLNLYFRHERPRRQGQKGQKVQFPRAIDVSNLMLVCPNCRKPRRVTFEVNEKGQKARVCKNCKKRI